MRQRIDLIRIVFASGSADLNHALIDRVAAIEPGLPLYIVSEFEPPADTPAQWIPWHVRRSFRENLAAARAAIGGKSIRFAAAVLAPGIPLGTMRLAAAAIAKRRLTVYDENLQPVKGAAWGRVLLKRLGEKARSQRTRHWLHRLAHPGDAEIPVRARAAQLRGIVTSRFRLPQREVAPARQDQLTKGIGIVIPSRNGRELLAEMLPFLVPQIGSGAVIVIDNGSNDGTAEWLALDHPGVRVIGSIEPLSFARAVNRGIQACGFTHTLLLNNDMIVQPKLLSSLISAFNRLPDLFCATAQIFFPPGIRRQETGKAVWRRGNPADFPVRCEEPLKGEDFTWVLYGSGGCSLYDTAKLRALGGVSEIFDPAYVEDLDLGYRAWKRGWPSVFCAEACVEHRHRATTSRYYSPAQIDAFVEINYLRFLTHAIGSAVLFRRLWIEAIRRLQLRAMQGDGASLEALRHIPTIGRRPDLSTGGLTENEILALGSGDVAVFQGRRHVGNNPVVVASPYLPFPLSHGGAVRMFNLMRRAAATRDQILVAFCDEAATPARELLEFCREVILVRRRGTHYRIHSEQPDVVEEFASDVFRTVLKQVVRQWRPLAVQLEFTQMAQYAHACKPAKTILVEHDITFELQQQLLASGMATGAARWELERQSTKWRKFETRAWREVDCVVTMSSKDEDAVIGAKRTTCVPNGVDTLRFQPPGTEPEPRCLLFIGSFAHLPNVLALEFFLRDVWPLLGTSFTLHVIGGARHEYFLDFHRSRVSFNLAAPGIEVEGFVSDVRDAYARAELVLAPLTASAGTNIKVLEAMAMGRVVVSTPQGVNGLELNVGRDVIVADSPEKMAKDILRLSSDPAERKRIERQARERALTFDWSEMAKRQEQLYASFSAER